MKNFYEPDDEHDLEDMENIPQYATERFSIQVDEILLTLEAQEYFVSDRTQVKHFKFSPQELEKYNHRFKSQWGIEINQDDYIWEIAEKIYENEL